MIAFINNWTFEKTVSKLYFSHMPCYRDTYIVNYLSAPGEVICAKCSDRLEIDEETFNILKFI